MGTGQDGTGSRHRRTGVEPQPRQPQPSPGEVGSTVVEQERDVVAQVLQHSLGDVGVVTVGVGEGRPITGTEGHEPGVGRLELVALLVLAAAIQARVVPGVIADLVARLEPAREVDARHRPTVRIEVSPAGVGELVDRRPPLTVGSLLEGGDEGGAGQVPSGDLRTSTFGGSGEHQLPPRRCGRLNQPRTHVEGGRDAGRSQHRQRRVDHGAVAVVEGHPHRPLRERAPTGERLADDVLAHRHVAPTDEIDLGSEGTGIGHLVVCDDAQRSGPATVRRRCDGSGAEDTGGRSGDERSDVHATPLRRSTTCSTVTGANVLGVCRGQAPTPRPRRVIGQTLCVHTLHLLATADRRGAEVFGFELAGGLTELGHDSDVVALAPSTSTGASLDVEVLEAVRRPQVLAQLRRRARQADAVVGHGSRGLVGGTLATVSTSTPLLYRSIGDPAFWGASRLRRTRVGLQLRRAAAVTALWPGAARTIASQYGVPSERVHVVPNAVDATRFRPADEHERTAARTELGLDPQRSVVLSLGALSPEKRVPLAIAAVAGLDDATLVIAGDGPDRAAVEREATRLLPGRHLLLGSVDDVRPLYAAADVLVLPSTTEGQPAVVIEAGLCGVPAVATDVGGVSTVVRHGQTGTLVPVDVTGDALSDALTSTLAQARSLGHRAHELCLEQFSQQAVASQWDALLESVQGVGR